MIPKKAFVHEDIYEAFEAQFVEKVGTLRVGLPSEPGISLSPVLKIAEFYQFLEDAVTRGARLLCGGTRVNHRGEPDAEGQFITPAVLAVDSVETALTMRCIQEENFFPLIPLVKVTGRHGVTGKGRERSILETMIGIANQNEYGLRISAWVRSIALRKQFMNEIHNSGILRINCRHVGFSPFMASHGGTGKSGGPYGELNYVWQKTTHLQGVTVNRLPQRNP